MVPEIGAQWQPYPHRLHPGSQTMLYRAGEPMSGHLLLGMKLSTGHDKLLFYSMYLSHKS